MKTKFLVIGVLSCFLFSCKTSLNINRPNEAYESLQVENKPSTLAMSVDLDIQQLENSLNNSLKGNIYEDNNFDDDNREVKVTKTGDFRFTVTNNVINCNLPLKVWVKTGYKKELLGLKAEDYYEATGAMLVNVSVAFMIDKDWTLKTGTTINGYQWTQKPVVSAAGVNIPITFLADMSIKALKGKISSAIDKTITEKVDLKARMAQTWSGLQDPIQIDKGYDVWLKILPMDVCTTPIMGMGKHLQINLALNSVIETNVGFHPTITPKNTLPPYKAISCVRPDFSVYSNVSVSYDKLTQMAQQFVVGQEFTKGSKKVRIDSLRLYGQNDHLVVQLSVSGSANGKVYCIGKLNYDNDTQTLQVTDFDFEMETRNVLLKSANWLLHKEFLKMIEPHLTISLKDQVNAMITSGNSFLKNYQIQKGVMLNGTLKNVRFNKITITKPAIVISGELNGNIKVGLGDLF